MPPLSDCTVAIAGLGLMGGSLGLALRGQVGRVIGIARAAASAEQALALGAADEVHTSLAAGLAEADLVVLATPVGVILEQLDQIGRLAAAGSVRPGLVVTDMGSTKVEICRAMAGLPEGVQAVGGHPMCGKEQSGLGAAEASLYGGATYVICPLPGAAPEAQALVAGLAQAVGARPLVVDPHRHDRLAAAISHVPYLLAAALFAAAAGTAEGDALLWQLAASGFRSTTRLAGSDDRMMADILATNRQSVLDGLASLQAQLDRLAALVAGDDEAALRAALAAIRAQRQGFLDAFGP